jgi:hypothetical protein
MKITPFNIICCAALVLSYSSRAGAQIKRDDFGDDKKPNAAKWDYSSGKVPPNGIWVGIHNAKNGGNAETPAAFLADGIDPLKKPRAGRLYIEDLGLHQHLNHNPPGDPLIGVGWEPQDSGKNNAPFLYTTIDAQTDFDVVTRVTSQYAGQWSYAAVIIRAAGTPVGRGTGEGLDPSENFVTVGSFRANSANGSIATLLLQNTRNGATGNPDIVTDLAPEGGTGALPIWIRLSKRGGTITAASSVDGEEWLAPDNATVNNDALSAVGKTLEVGVAYMRFNNPQTPEGVRPAAVFDFFELRPLQADGSLPMPVVVGAASVLLLLIAAIALMRRKTAS